MQIFFVFVTLRILKLHYDSEERISGDAYGTERFDRILF